jgi:hypothetical protein
VRVAGNVSVCVQLYCVGFHCFTTCFSLHGHLQVSRIFHFHMLEELCFAAFFMLFFHVVTLCMLPSVGWLIMRYYYLLFMLFLVLLYVCFFTCVFSSVFLRMVCIYVHSSLQKNI